MYRSMATVRFHHTPQCRSEKDRIEDEAERLRMIRLILGSDYQDLPLNELVNAHHGSTPRWHELLELAPTPLQPDQAEPLEAIEDGERRQPADDWLNTYLRTHDGSARL